MVMSFGSWQKEWLWIHVVKMSFLHWLAGLSFRNRVRSSAIRRESRVEPLLLRVKRSQLRCFDHQIRRPPGRLPFEVFWAHPTARGPRVDPEHTRGIVSGLPGLGMPWGPQRGTGKHCWGGTSTFLNCLPLREGKGNKRADNKNHASRDTGIIDDECTN